MGTLDFILAIFDIWWANSQGWQLLYSIYLGFKAHGYYHRLWFVTVKRSCINLDDLLNLIAVVYKLGLIWILLYLIFHILIKVSWGHKLQWTFKFHDMYTLATNGPKSRRFWAILDGHLPSSFIPLNRPILTLWTVKFHPLRPSTYIS